MAAPSTTRRGPPLTQGAPPTRPPGRPCATCWRRVACGRRRPVCRRDRWRRHHRLGLPIRRHRLPGFGHLVGCGREHFVGDRNLARVDGPLAVITQGAGLQRRPPVPLGILVGGVGRVDRVDHGGPGGGQYLDAGEVPEVPGVGHDRVEVAVDPGVERGREVAGAEDQRFQALARLRDLERVGQSLRLLNQDLQPDRPGETELGFELGQEHIDPPHVAGPSHFRHDQHIDCVACPGHDLNDVAMAPGRVEAVHADGPDRPAPVLSRQRSDRDRPRGLLDRGRAGVLEVEEDEVRPR